MRDFDSILKRICGSVLSEVFGKNGNLLRYWKIDSSDCCKNPQEFDDALVDSFQPMGALVIETRILTRFYRRIGAKYSASEDLNFAAEIRRARIEFEKIAAEEELAVTYSDSQTRESRNGFLRGDYCTHRAWGSNKRT